jgi:ppGpp synthetase/RelA/SpoT-type nucleotidyltranferase
MALSRTEIQHRTCAMAMGAAFERELRKSHASAVVVDAAAAAAVAEVAVAGRRCL